MNCTPFAEHEALTARDDAVKAFLVKSGIEARASRPKGSAWTNPSGITPRRKDVERTDGLYFSAQSSTFLCLHLELRGRRLIEHTKGENIIADFISTLASQAGIDSRVAER
jgi:hypothetical protein